MNKIDIPKDVFEKWNDNSYIAKNLNDVIKHSNDVSVSRMIRLHDNLEYAFYSGVVFTDNNFVCSFELCDYDYDIGNGIVNTKMIKTQFPVKKNGVISLGTIMISLDRIGFHVEVLSDENWYKNLDTRLLGFYGFRYFMIFHNIQTRALQCRNEISKIITHETRVLKDNYIKYNPLSTSIILRNGIVFSHVYEDIRKYIRHTEAWDVRGHYRHYKNGKTVYIKPYTKGNGTPAVKNYVI